MAIEGFPSLPSPPGLTLPKPGSAQELSDSELKKLMKTLGHGASSAITTVGSFMDVPAGIVRNIAGGGDVMAVLKDPFSQQGRVEGRELLVQRGLAPKNVVAPWFSDEWWKDLPYDLAGIGTEIMLDPLTYMTFGMSALGKAGKLAKAAGALEDMTSLAAKAGKGPRQFRMTSTIEDFMKVPDFKQRYEGNLQKAAKSMGMDYDKVIKEKIGSLGQFGLPEIMGLGGLNVGFGSEGNRLAMGTAKALDFAGEKIKNTAVARAAAAVFDHRVFGGRNRKAVHDARILSRALEHARANARFDLVDDVTEMFEKGWLDPGKIAGRNPGMSMADAQKLSVDTGIAMMDYIERGQRQIPMPQIDPSDPNYASVMDQWKADNTNLWMQTPEGQILSSHKDGQRIMQMMDKLRDIAKQDLDNEFLKGVSTDALNDAVIDYMTRQRIFPADSVVRRRNRRGGMVYDATSPSQMKRKSYHMHLPGGTSILQRMSLDKNISGIARKKGFGSKELDNAAKYIEATYGDELVHSAAEVQDLLDSKRIDPDKYHPLEALMNDDESIHFTMDVHDWRDKTLRKKAKHLASEMSELDPWHVEQGVPMFNYNPVDVALYRHEMSSQVNTAAQGVYNFLAPMIRSAGDVAEEGGSVNLYEFLKDFPGLTPDGGARNMFENMTDDMKPIWQKLYNDAQNMPTGKRWAYTGYGGAQPPKEARKVMSQWIRPVPADHDRMFINFDSQQPIDAQRDVFNAMRTNGMNGASATSTHQPGASTWYTAVIDVPKGFNGRFDGKDIVAVLPANATVENVARDFNTDIVNSASFIADPTDWMARNADIPRWAADESKRFMNMFKSPQEMAELVDYFDRIQRLWKKSVTVLWPAFHSRNFVSGFLRNVAANAWSYQDNADAVKILSGSKKISGIAKRHSVYDRAGKRITDDAAATKMLRDELFATRVLEHHTGQAGEVLRSAGEITDIPGITKAFPGTSRGATGFQKNVNIFSDEHFLSRGGSAASYLVEGNNRVTAYLNKRRKGWTPWEASREVDRLQVRYENLSAVEREVFRRAAPFYAFSRGVIPWTFREFTENPGHFTPQVARATARARSGDPIVPEEVESSVALNIGDSENAKYITGLGLMEEPFYRLAGPMLKSTAGAFSGELAEGTEGVTRELIGNTNPALKTMLEVALNRSTYFAGAEPGGRDLDTLDPPTGRLIENIAQQLGAEPAAVSPLAKSRWPDFFKRARDRDIRRVEQSIGMSPLSRIVGEARKATDPRKDFSERMINLLMGPRYITMSPQRKEAMLSEKVQQMLRNYGGEDYKVTYMTDEKEAALSPENRAIVELLERYRVIQSRNR